MQENPVISDWVPFRGEALKDRSAGGWRSGRRRSEVSWRRGHSQPFDVFRACRLITEHVLCHEKLFLETCSD